MAITIILNDGSINVGGEFWAAKAAVKSLPGARWSPEHKEWQAPAVTVAEAKMKLSGLPLDVNGPTASYHTTRYGNTYSNDEWRMMKEAEAAASTAARPFAARRRQLAQEATARLDALGIPPAGRGMLLEWARFDTNVECGRIRFSSPERERQIREFVAWYGDEDYKLAKEEIDAEDEAREAIYSKYLD